MNQEPEENINQNPLALKIGMGVHYFFTAVKIALGAWYLWYRSHVIMDFQITFWIRTICIVALFWIGPTMSILARTKYRRILEMTPMQVFKLYLVLLTLTLATVFIKES